LFGAGRQVRDLIYMTVSTGVGGGIVLGGKIHRGASFCGGEIGHATIVPGGNHCQCGKKGCLEAYASGTAIAADARKYLRGKRPSRILRSVVESRGRVTGEVVFEAARLGDMKAKEILSDAGRFLGIGISSLINVVNPEMIVLGGSVMKARAYFWQSMMRAIRENSWPMALAACEIRLTALGSYVGSLGAAALVLENRK
ncbi:MAG TPA: ROK family protein, partial [Candidatus Omnitrophota bacterium]|nr:ROK family protein [Candidatus Omnitrophota bacterium]